MIQEGITLPVTLTSRVSFVFVLRPRPVLEARPLWHRATW